MLSQGKKGFDMLRLHRTMRTGMAKEVGAHVLSGPLSEQMPNCSISHTHQHAADVP